MKRFGTATRVSGVAAVAALAFGVVGCAPAASGEEIAYPDGQLTYIIPFAPGGSSDPSGREFSRLLAEELGTTVVVENMPGGDETIGLTAVFSSPADGHTIGLSSPAGVIVQPLINDALPFKTTDDYTPVSLMLQAPNALFVGKDSKYQTIEDLLADAKANPGKISIGTTGRYTSPTFQIVQLEAEAGVEFNIVPFSGGAGEAALAAVGGKIDAYSATVPGQLGLFTAGDIRALVHTGSPEYNSVLPGAVSYEEVGINNPFGADYMTVAPKGLPDAVRAKLVEAANKVASGEAWGAWTAERGFTATPAVGDDLLKWIEDMAKLSASAIELVNKRLQ